MRDIWVVSDTHFGHENIIKYCDRPFHNAHEMNEVIRDNWNKTVKDGDIVYHLGDVYFPGGFGDGNAWEFMATLKGSKRLILGNHDDGKNQLIQKVFQKVGVWRHFREFGLLLTHVPVHEGTLNEKVPVNVHGHIHNNKIPDKRYRCVCVEHTDYTPVHIETLRVR